MYGAVPFAANKWLGATPRPPSCDDLEIVSEVDRMLRVPSADARPAGPSHRAEPP